MQVADFGTAKLVDAIQAGGDVGTANEMEMATRRESSPASSGHESFAMTKGIGTLLWMAPELMKGQPYGLPVDVYRLHLERTFLPISFGIILWEIWARALPFEDLSTVWQIRAAVEEGVRPRPPAAMSPALVDLMVACWNGNPQVRPTFAHISSQLKSLNMAQTL